MGSRDATAIALSAVAVFGVAACGGGKSGGAGAGARASTPTPEREAFSGPGGTLTLRVNSDWPDFDMQANSQGPKSTLAVFAYDRLLAMDAKGKLIPYLAKSWKTTPHDVTFTLRTDAKCADGTPVTPTVVRDSFQRMIKDGGANQALFGPGPYSVSADDAAGTFTFRSKTANSDLEYGFANANAGIVCPSGLKDTARLKTGMYGSGPYELVSAQHARQVVFKLRPDWKWGPEGVTAQTPGLPTQVVVRVVTDDTTAANLLTTGEIDISQVAGADVSRLDKLVESGQLRKKVASSATLTPLGFNMRAGHVTADPAVRKALSLAVDEKAYNQAANFGSGTTGTSYITPATKCFDPRTKDIYPSYDLEAARKTLLDAGYTMSGNRLVKDGKPLTIDLLGSTYQNTGPDYLASQYDKLGVEVKLDKIEPNTYGQRLFKGEFDVAPEQWGHNYPSPGDRISYGSGKTPQDGGTNLSAAGADDKEYNEEIAAAYASVGEASCRHWARVQEIMLQRNYFKPLAAPNTPVFYQGKGVDLIPFLDPGAPEPWALRKAG